MAIFVIDIAIFLGELVRFSIPIFYKGKIFYIKM